MPSLRRTLLGLGIAFLVVSPWKLATGADITWSAPANGNWNVAANWSPPQVPGPADHAHITPPGSPTITLNADAQVARLTLGDGTDSPILAIPSSGRRLNVSGQLAILPRATLRHGGILTNGPILVAGEFAWTGGTLEGSPTTPLRVDILAGGRLSLTNEAQRTLRHATLHNAGIVRWSLGRVNAAAGDCRFLNEGFVEIDRATAGAWTVAAAGTTARIENLPTGTLVKTGPSTATLDPDIINQGTFQIDSGTLSARASTGRYTQSSGRTVLHGGTLQAAGGILLLGGVLEGHGTLAGPVQNSGILRPGASPGELLVTSSLDLTAQSILDLEIAGTASGLFDRLQVAGRTRRAGAVQVAFLDGFKPKAGDSFPFLASPDGTSGRFDSFASPAGPPWLDLIEHSQGARFTTYEGPSSLALRIESSPTLQLTAEQRLSLPVTLSFPEGDVDAVTLSVTTPDPALIPPATSPSPGRAGREP